MPKGKEHDQELDALLKSGPAGYPDGQRDTNAFINVLKGSGVTCETLKRLNEEIGPYNRQEHTEVNSAKHAIAAVSDHKKCPQKGR